jgi:hypothetical protein
MSIIEAVIGPIGKIAGQDHPRSKARDAAMLEQQLPSVRNGAAIRR